MAVIGSAEVEVRADVRKLGKDITDSFDGLEAQADQIANRMGKSISDSLKNNLDGLTIQVDIDADHFLDQMSAIEGMLNDVSNKQVKVDVDTSGLDSIKDSLDSISPEDLNVEAKPTVSEKAQSKFVSDVDKLLDQARQAAAAFDADIAFDATIDDALDQLVKLQEEIESISDNDLELALTLDQSSVEQINTTIEALRAYNSANAIDLEVEVHMAKAMAQLALLGRKRVVELIPKVNLAAASAAQGVLAGFTGFNIMREHTEDFIKSLTELDKQIPQLAAQMIALSAVIPVAGFGAGALTMLIGDLATLSGLLVPATGLFLGVAAATTVFNLAMDDVAKRFPEVTSQFGAMKAEIQSGFWAEAEAPLRRLADTLPLLVDSMSVLTSATGRFTGSLMDAISNVLETDRGMGNLNTIFENTASGMDNMSRGFQPLIQAILTIGRVGSKFLPELGTYIADLAEQFDAWVQSADESGDLMQWAEDAVETLKELGSIVGSTIGIFYSLYQVASTVGFPGLTEIADGMSRLNEVLKTDTARSSLERLGTSVKGAFDTIASSLSWIGPLITENFDGIVSTISVMGDIVGGVLSGIGDALTNTDLVPAFFGLFESLKTAVTEFRPAFESIGTIAEVTFKFLGSALENITPILEQFFENLANDAELIKPSFMGMLDVIGEWGPQVMTIVGKVTNKVAEWIGKLDPVLALAGVAFVALSPLITGLGLAFVGVVSYISKFVGAVGRIGAAFGKTQGGAAILKGGLKGLGGGISSLMSRVATAIPGIGWIVGAFISAFAASEELRTAVGTFLANAFKTLGAFIQPIIGPIGELFGVLMGGLDKIGAAVAPAFTGLFNALNSIMPILQLVANFLGAVLGGAIKVLSAALESVFNTIATVLGGVANVIGGAFNTIAALVTGVIGIVKGLVTGDMSAVADAAKGMWDGLKDAWGQMLGGAIQAVVGVFTGAADLVMSAIKGLFEGALHVLDNFDLFPQAQAIIQSLIDGFGNAINAVRDWLQDLTQKIIEWKGPPANDATLLNEAGASIIQSLVDGFKTAVEAVFTFLQELTQRIVTVVMNIVNSVITFFQTGWAMLVTVVQTVWNGIVTVIQTVLTMVMDIVQLYVNLVVTIFRTGWNILTTVVQTVWNFIVTIIQTVWTTIITVIQTYITIVTTIFRAGWNLLVTIVQTVFNAIILVIQTVWLGIQNIIRIGLTTIKTIFTSIWNAIVLVVTTVWTGIKNTIMIAINAVRSIITTVMTAIMTIIRTIWNTIKTVTLTVWNGIKALIRLGLAAIKALISGNFDAFLSIIRRIWNVIKSVTSSVWNAIKSAISSILSTIKSVISSVFNAIKSTIRSIMNSIKSTISSVWNAIKSAVSSVINSIRSAVSSGFNAVRSVVSSVMNAIRSITSSVWNSIRSTISSVISTVRSVVSSGVNAARSAVSNAWNAARSLTTSAWNSIVSAIRNAASRLMGIVRDIPGKIKSALGNLGGMLKGAGRSIIQGLIDGVSGMIGSLKSKFSSITDMIPSWKGPPDTDAKLLTNAGELIMDGLISGLESKYGAVRNSLQGFTGDLSQTVGTHIGADVGLSTSVRNSALSNAERRLAYRSGSGSMVESNGDGIGREVHLHFHNALVNESEIITVVNRELGRGV